MMRGPVLASARYMMFLFLIVIAFGWVAPVSLDTQAASQNNQSFQVSPNRLDFGNVPVNTISQPKSFTITNGNKNNLSVSVELKSNCTGLRTSPTKTTIPAGGSAAIQVTLERIQIPGSFHCTITVLTNDFFSNQKSGNNNSPFPTVEIEANITSPKLVISKFTVQRTGGIKSNNSGQKKQDVLLTQNGNTLTADFGELDIFEKVTLQIELRNAGNAPMDLRISGSLNQDFTCTGFTNKITLAPSQTTQIQCNILSIRGGQLKGTINIDQINAPTSLTRRFDIQIKGLGNMILVQPSNAFLTFNVRVFSLGGASSMADDSSILTSALTGSASQSITFTNQGQGGDLAIANVELKIENVEHQGSSKKSGGKSSVSSSATSTKAKLFRFVNGTDQMTFSLDPRGSQRVTVLYIPQEPGLDQGVIHVTVSQQSPSGSSKKSSKGKQVQEFFINLRGIATPSTQTQSNQSPLAISRSGLGQTGDDWTFFAQGQGLEALRAEVFTLDGERIYDSGFVPQETLHWRPRTQGSDPLANGIYFYLLTVRGQDGRTISTEIRKFALLR
ncbi:MAG: hypothetical protein A2Z21_05525 [Candidatus Fraserbacteria bacterium RBG_16_55_9]|uniref:HYDIN/VesB/CFA65-like Ig-like domain-containing protein n=1 Tax=Fraserbacteria sp. (strain RBG_16_55_9) TaxID=1817864 RepID=A0A1F5UPX7_FRAXR|nr:MAG: hypothetical protein A2Z21_05525 [Candidatus Fraserbacteria bacterium RBG_16_55_9]